MDIFTNVSLQIHKKILVCNLIGKNYAKRNLNILEKLTFFTLALRTRLNYCIH